MLSRSLLERGWSELLKEVSLGGDLALDSVSRLGLGMEPRAEVLVVGQGHVDLPERESNRESKRRKRRKGRNLSSLHSSRKFTPAL